CVAGDGEHRYCELGMVLGLGAHTSEGSSSCMGLAVNGHRVHTVFGHQIPGETRKPTLTNVSELGSQLLGTGYGARGALWDGTSQKLLKHVMLGVGQHG